MTRISNSSQEFSVSNPRRGVVQMAKEAVKLGALGYLPTPFEHEQILEAIRGVLKSHGASL